VYESVVSSYHEPIPRLPRPLRIAKPFRSRGRSIRRRLSDGLGRTWRVRRGIFDRLWTVRPSRRRIFDRLRRPGFPLGRFLQRNTISWQQGPPCSQEFTTSQGLTPRRVALSAQLRSSRW